MLQVSITFTYKHKLTTLMSILRVNPILFKVITFKVSGRPPKGGRAVVNGALSLTLSLWGVASFDGRE